MTGETGGKISKYLKWLGFFGFIWILFETARRVQQRDCILPGFRSMGFFFRLIAYAGLAQWGLREIFLYIDEHRENLLWYNAQLDISFVVIHLVGIILTYRIILWQRKHLDPDQAHYDELTKGMQD